VDCPGYLADGASRAQLASLPLEHLAFEARRAAPDRLVPRLINRLRRERLGFGGLDSPVAALLRLPGAPAADPGAAWSLQSYPATSVGDARAGVAAIRTLAAGAGHVFFARPGDLIHPSAATVVARTGDGDVVTWNRFSADEARAGSPGLALRRAGFDPASARHGAMTDVTLALKGDILERCPEDVLAALAAGRLHPLWFWLAGQGLRWRDHPEALTSDVRAPFHLDEAEARVDEAIYRRILDEEGGAFTLSGPLADLPFPYVLTPSRRARTISVVVCFRDAAALTLRCVQSLARQTLTGGLELVLVDNQSAPGEARRILQGAQALLGKDRVTWVAYDRPFNHSAQNNLGARAASGEVLVICNNDVELDAPDLLEQLAAWALQPDVATVGCRLEDPDRRTGSYGHLAQPPSANPFQPALRENPDAVYGRRIHAVAGSTLAIAAVARDRFLALRGLDEVRFPIGYNDIDFMLRCSAAGLTHLYLGHVSARHARGSSRTGDDESLQALWINQAHRPDAVAHVRQFARERVEGLRDGPVPAAAVVSAGGTVAAPPPSTRLHRLLLAGARLRRRLWG